MVVEIVGNSIYNWLLAIGIVLGAVVVGRLIHFSLSGAVRRFTKNTDTSFDDYLLEALRTPILLFVFYFGFKYSYAFLTFSERVVTVLDNGAFVVLVLGVVFLIKNLLTTIAIRYFAKVAEKTDTTFDDQLIPVLNQLIKVIVFSLAIVYLVDNLGYDVASLLAGLGIGGLAFALAAQDSLKNFVAGITIFADKPFELGDRIKLGDEVDGYIKEVGLRTTIVETKGGRYLTVPNEKITDNIVENVTQEPSRRVQTTLGLEYSTTKEGLQKAKNLLKSITKETPGVQNDCTADFTAFGPSSLHITFIYYIEDLDNIFDRMDAVNTAVKERFEKEGLEFAYPSHTVYVKD